MRRRPVRSLGVGRDRFRWALSHAHDPCREIVRIQREGSPGRLVVTFITPAGYPLHAGQALHADGRDLNLNRPGVARVLLDAALAGGWQPEVSGTTELGGWALVEAAGGRLEP